MTDDLAPLPTSAELQSGKALANELARLVDGLDVQGGWRGHLSAAFHSVSLDHHAAILCLLEGGHPASAMALVRPQFEAYLRGLWIAYAASDQQVERFSERGDIPKPHVLVNDLDGKVAVVSVIKGQMWDFMCDYTHTGLRQVSRNITDHGVGKDYHPIELSAAVAASNSLALLAADAVAALANAKALQKQLEARALAMLSE